MQPNRLPVSFDVARKNATSSDAKIPYRIIRDELYLSHGDRTWVTRQQHALSFESSRAAGEFLRRYPAELKGAQVA